jgi:hypothetical protein
VIVKTWIVYENGISDPFFILIKKPSPGDRDMPVSSWPNQPDINTGVHARRLLPGFYKFFSQKT